MGRTAVPDVSPWCSPYYSGVDLSFIRRKELTYAWGARGDSITIRVSDYLDDAPANVLGELCAMVCRRGRGMDWRYPHPYIEHVTSDRFILERRPQYVARSRNLLRTSVGETADLFDSVQRLLDSGLLDDSDIGNAYLSWTRRESVRRVGFCSTMFRVVGISARLDSPDVPNEVRDYVVYHECLHLRQGYRPEGRVHDAAFRGWERAYPGWREAEAFLRRLRRHPLIYGTADYSPWTRRGGSSSTDPTDRSR